MIGDWHKICTDEYETAEAESFGALAGWCYGNNEVPPKMTEVLTDALRAAFAGAFNHGYEAAQTALSAPSEPAAKIDSSEWFGGGCPTCTPVVVPLTVPFTYFEPANDVTLHVNSQGSDGLAFVAVPKREPDGPHVQYGVVMPKDIAAVLARRMLATLEPPPAPSEPVPDGPRVWELPVVPSDVQVVSDRDGWIWRRATDYDIDRWWRRAGGMLSAESRLIDERGPLTEVVEEATR